MKISSYLLIAITILFVQACSKENKCEKNHTGSIEIDNDDPFMPPGGTSFYLESGEKIGTVGKGQVETFDGVPVGDHLMYVLFYSDTLYADYITIEECQTTFYATSSWNAASDYRLKHNIAPLGNVLSQLAKLSVYSYEYDNCAAYSKYLSKGTHYGFMAQELAAVYPSFSTTDEQGFHHVNYEELIPILTKGVQEQQAQIKALQEELEALKWEVDLKKVK